MNPPTSTDALPASERFTLGLVQSRIEIGMKASTVLEILGSPNMVKGSDKGGEVWVYDKVSSTRSTVGSSTSIGLLGGGTNVGGGVGASSSEISSESSQSTLTVVLHFNLSEELISVAYHRSQF
jgi:outer membrane protein assembly factor BamE (lipoprotein component of BamABCDE complex)